MKKILLLVLMAFLAACSNKPQPNEQTTAQALPLAEDNNAVVAFEAFLKTLPIAEEQSAGKAATYFQEHFTPSNKAANDKAFVAFMKFHRAVGDTLSWVLQENPEMETLTALEKEQTPAVRQRISQLTTYGFRVEPVEGTFVLVQEPAYFENIFKDYFSSTMYEYFTGYKKEQINVLIDDGSILVPVKELGERAVWWEKFNEKYPDFALKEETQFRQKDYLALLLAGERNTPTFDYETGEFNPEFKKTFEYIISTYPDTRVGKEVKQYYEILRETNFRKSEKSEKFLSKYAQQYN